jgi:protein-S-isoprenylcysteine O-methyltransferase Ste14
VKAPMRTFTALRAAVYATAFVALWTWLALSARRYDARLGVAVPAWLRPVGWVLLVAGGLLALACVVTFVVRGRGTPAPFDPPREFVATGPYRYVRNPMYAGGLTAILGGGLVLGSASIVVLALAFLLLMHAFVVFVEEPSLGSRFGASYRAYKDAVGRWLPGSAKKGRPS